MSDEERVFDFGLKELYTYLYLAMGTGTEAIKNQSYEII